MNPRPANNSLTCGCRFLGVHGCGQDAQGGAGCGRRHDDRRAPYTRCGTLRYYEAWRVAACQADERRPSTLWR
jgi:hypothetical protein